MSITRLAPTTAGSTAPVRRDPAFTMSGTGRTALVTGASGGIGLELTRLFAAGGYDLVLAGRNGGTMTSIGDGLASEHGVTCRISTVDLGEPGAAQALWAELTRAGVHVDVLVNNAGIGTYGNLWDQDPATLRQLVALNVEALTMLTRSALPGMLERRSGRILNVASVLAFQPGGPRWAAYYASKAYVLSFSKGLSEELRGTGVTVTALCPGLTRTRFMQQAGAIRTHYDALPQSTPEDVARAGYDGLMRGRRVVIPGVLTKILAIAGELPPRRIALAVNEYLTRRA